MKIDEGKRVTIEYQLSIDGGELLESSDKSGPLEYIHGSGRMLPGLEKRLEGCTAGDEMEGVLLAVEAYGTKEDLPTRELTRADFPEGDSIEIGSDFEATGPDGNPVLFEVESIDGDDIIVRFKHPLAGKNISYTVKVLKVSDPTPPPLPPE